jgi:hypothetical protein
MYSFLPSISYEHMWHLPIRLVFRAWIRSLVYAEVDVSVQAQ